MVPVKGRELINQGSGLLRQPLTVCIRNHIKGYRITLQCYPTVTERGQYPRDIHDLRIQELRVLGFRVWGLEFWGLTGVGGHMERERERETEREIEMHICIYKCIYIHRVST